MKILLACSQYPPMKTGYAIIADRLSSWFRHLGHDVEVITEGRGCSRMGRVALLGETGRKMFAQDPDIVEVIGPTPFFSEQCVRAANKKGLPVVYVMNAFPGLSSYYRIPGSGFLDSLYKKFNLYRTIRDVDLMVFQTNDFAENFTPYYDGPFEVIPYGIDAQDLNGQSNRLPPNNRILFVGQLRRYKGIPYLIAAVKQLRNAGRDLVLDIVGDGPDRKRILNLISKLKLQDAIFLHGNASSRKELDMIYRRSELLVLPSVEGESFGIVLLEAAARGVPVVASDLSGVREVVEYIGGMLVQPGNTRALANAIAKSLYTNSKRAQSTIPADMTRFLWEKIAKRHLDCLGRVLGLSPEPALAVPGIAGKAAEVEVGTLA
ncbi:MAG TPA: glycosyltransferase family 4 protein [Candidatus Angelobacter sp.]|nr:glycosyltransferase family 4 protein [Candidatus Angelobacter sp.]